MHIKVLITGGDGFLGSQNAEFILEKYPDSEVVLIDDLSRANGENAKYLREKYKQRVTLVVQDVRNLEKIKDHFTDVDRVYHMAAQVTMTKSMDDPMFDYQVNSTGTMNVLEAVRLKCPEAPVVYCSTNKVYGDILAVRDIGKGNVRLEKIDQEKDIVPEKDRYVYADRFTRGVTEDGFHVGPEAANCPYGSSKMAGELWMKNYADSFGIKTVRARMSCIYGTRQFGNEDQGWLSWFTIRTLLGKNIVIYGDGMQVRDALFATDHARAFDLLATTQKCHGGAFNLGGGPENTISLKELLALIEAMTGKRSPVKYAGWRHGDQKVYISNIDKMKAFTGFVPQVTIREGLQRMIEWTQDNLKTIMRIAGDLVLRDL
nr:GDP-mannose 4,6-dehydratase [Candidatus Sigynarchaeota archaeon]